MLATSFRWAARGLSLLVVGFFGYFLLASLVGDAARGPRPLTTSDYTSLVAIVTSLAGLCAAWKWERAGAAVTLVSVTIGATVNWAFVASPVVVIPITAGLFLAAAATRQTTVTGDESRFRQEKKLSAHG